MIREYLFDIAKIIEGAANNDPEKVIAYSQQLGTRLENAGEKEGAKRIRQILGKCTAAKLVAARASGSRPDHLPVDSESRMPIADEERTRRGEVPMILSGQCYSTVAQFLDFFRAADRLVANGVGVSPTMLIYGPPGCGKTQLARYIASELDLPLLTARTDALISSFLGSTSKNIRMLFDHATSRPCVLFLDEFDAIAKMRDDGRELGELKRVVISLLQNIDAIGKDHVLIAATNHEHLLDPAIWRRFSFHLNVSLPDRASREAMISQFLGRFDNDVFREILSAISNGMSGGQIREIVENAVRSAVIKNENEVAITEIVRSVLSAKLGPLNKASIDDQVRAVRAIDESTFTQQRLAELFGISQSNVSYILTGKRSNGKRKISSNRARRATKR